MKKEKEIKLKIHYVPPTEQSRKALFELGRAIFWKYLKQGGVK